MVTAVLFESNSGIMSQLISLGAFNKMTDEYVYPEIANKHDHYVCPHCNQDVILVKGSKIRDHFRHKTNKAAPCKYYNAPNEICHHCHHKQPYTGKVMYYGGGVWGPCLFC